MLLATSLNGCGGSDSSHASGSSGATTATDVSSISGHDLAAAQTMGRHNETWGRAYDRWDKAYRAGQRAAFLASVAHDTPVMSREADAGYRAALSVDDTGLRGQYAKLERWYLRQTAAISAINDAVKASDTSELTRQVRKLDRVRAEGPDLVEAFQNYTQRRFGRNLLHDVGG